MHIRVSVRTCYVYWTHFSYGYGIYTTPDPRTALKYGKEFAFNNKRYKAIFQVPFW